MTEGALPPTSSSVLVDRGSLYTLSTFAQLATAILVLPALTRLLTPAEFGRLTTALIVAQVLGMVGSLGIPVAITRAYFLDLDGPAGASRLVVHAAGLAVVTCSVVAATTSLWSSAIGFPESRSLALAAVAGAPLAITFAVQALLRARDHVLRFVALSAGTAFAAPLAGLLALLVEPTANTYIWGWFATQSVVAASGLILSLGAHNSVTSGLLRRALRIAVPTIPHVAAIYLLNVSDRFVVQASEGFMQVGRYQVAYLIGGAGIVAINALNNAWAPLIYQAEPQERHRVLSDTTRTVERLAAGAVVGVSMGAPWLLILAAPSDYDRDALVPVVATIALAAMPMVVYLANAHLVFVTGKTGLLAVITPAAAAAKIVVAILLVSLWGLIGAGIATVFAYLLLAVGLVLARRRVAPQAWSFTLDTPSWVLGTASAVGGALLPSDGGPALTVRLLALGVLLAVAATAGGRIVRTGGWPSTPR